MKTATTTGSLERFMRTFIQIAVADSAAYPALLAAFNISPTLAAKIIGIVNAIVLAVVAIQNALESKGVVPTMLRPEVAPPTLVPTATIGGSALLPPILSTPVVMAPLIPATPAPSNVPDTLLPPIGAPPTLDPTPGQSVAGPSAS